MVDNNIANLTMGGNLLKSRCEVYLASSAAQMFEMPEKIRPDLILLDVEMPEVDGYEAIAKLRRNHLLADESHLFLSIHLKTVKDG